MARNPWPAGQTIVPGSCPGQTFRIVSAWCAEAVHHHAWVRRAAGGGAVDGPRPAIVDCVCTGLLGRERSDPAGHHGRASLWGDHVSLFLAH